MRDALHAEWTKLRTLAGTAWLLSAVVAGTVAVGATVLATRTEPPGPAVDLVRLSLAGVLAGQAVVVVLAVASIGGEYGTGMVATTFVALPRRLLVLAAKAATVGGATAVGGTLAVGGSLLAGRLVLSQDFPPSPGRAAVGSVLYLVLVALLSLGVATAVRDSATATGTVLGLLYVFPVLAQTVSDPTWHRRLEQIGPMTAGLSVQTTTDLSSRPIGPWSGLGVLCAWTAGALLVAVLSLRRRDV